MPIFYRGAGVDTWWHTHDARLTGFLSQNPGNVATIDRLMLHIARGTTTSPYVSLTRSYGVAWSYATFMGRAIPTESLPAYIYEIEIDDPRPPGLQVLDPVKNLAAALPDPLHRVSYQHDGLPDFLHGVISRGKMKTFLDTTIKQPPPGEGTPRPATLSLQLETLIRAMCDAEILAIGAIPSSCVRNRYEVY